MDYSADVELVVKGFLMGIVIALPLFFKLAAYCQMKKSLFRN